MQPELQPIRTGTSIPASDYAVQQNRVLRNTYWLLALSLIPTIIGAAIGTNIDLGFMRTSPVLSFFAVLAIFYGWIFAIERNRNSSLGVGLLLGFTLFMGLLLGPLLQSVLGFKNGIQLVFLPEPCRVPGIARDVHPVLVGCHPVSDKRHRARR